MIIGKNMKKGKKAAALMMAMMLSLSVAVPVYADDISDAKKKQEELEEQKKAAEAAQADLAGKLDSVIANMQKTEEELTAKEEEINVAETELVWAKAKENDQYESMKLRIKYMYENGNTGFLEILMEAKSMSDFLNKAEYINQISEMDRQQLVEFQNTRKDIEEKEAALKEEYAQLETLRTELQGQQAEVQALLDEKNLEIDSLTSEISANADKLKELVAAAEAAAERQRQSQSNGYQPAGGNSNIVVSGNGQLSHPVPGAYITSGFGNRVAPTAGATSRHDGIDYGAGTGTAIYAADAGTVITAKFNSARGYYVVINHGNGMQTWYQHCSAMYVSAGQTVSRGQNIAAVGSTGVVTGPHLHFEVHVNGTPVNPQLYL